MVLVVIDCGLLFWVCGRSQWVCGGLLFWVCGRFRWVYGFGCDFVNLFFFRFMADPKGLWWFVVLGFWW